MSESKPAFALALWQRLATKPGGAWLFSQAISRKAPYFKTIAPRFRDLRPGRCEVYCKNRRAVHNHIGTFHAIAMCNMAEVAGGLMTEVSIPATHRWIPKGMTVEYLKKAETDLVAVASVDPLPSFGAAAEFITPVEVRDSHGDLVFRARISMWVSPKKA